ncbi:MAG: amidohydrolase [Thermotogaceae bacterium]|nr:amidohydrolase [Thermotogaceae bacterium]
MRKIAVFLLALLSYSLVFCGGPEINSATAQEKITLFINGTVVTVDEQMTEAQAVAVKGDRIIAVGTNEEIVKFITEDSEVINLKGKTLMPGFVEVHSHPFVKMVVESAMVDLRPAVGYTDGEKIMDMIEEAVAKAEPGEYLVFFGWDPLLQKGLKNPTKKELDAIAPNNPLFIWGNSVHIGFANSMAFELAGITKDTPDPVGAMAGTFGRDENGELDGRLDQGGPISMLIKNYLLEYFGGPQQLAEAVYHGWLVNASDGVTTISDNVLEKDILTLYQLTERLQKTLRLRGYAVDYKNIVIPDDSEMIKMVGGKLFIDGSPWTGTISMREPYLVNDTTTGIMDTPAGYMQEPYVTRQELQDFIDDILIRGISAAIHAEGDLAIDWAMDAIEAGLQKYPTADHRIRLEHVPMIRDDQLERAKRLGVAVSFLMAHVRYWGDVIPTLVGEERGQRWCPVASAVKYDVSYSFHFDGPTSPNKPLESLQTAVTRETVNGRILGPEECISIDEAIRGYTINAAYQLFMDKEIGSIEVGKLADLIILSENPREVDPEKISEIEVLATYINGEVFWSKDSRLIHF